MGNPCGYPKHGSHLGPEAPYAFPGVRNKLPRTPPPPHPIGKQSWLRFSTRCTGHWVTQTWASGQSSCRPASPSGRTPPFPLFVPSAARRTQMHGLFMFHPHNSSYMYV